MKNSRLQAIINFVPKKTSVADIGTDHAYLPIELVKQKKISKIIATDKNLGPTQAAEKNIFNAGFQNFIEVRQGDGLKILKIGEVETICISGMGGKLISEILANSPEVFNSANFLILQPMNATDFLKNFLKNNNWFIADEDLAEEDKIIYEIIFATKNPSQIKSPTKKENSPLLKKFFAQKAEKVQKIIAEMKKSPSAVSTEKFLQLQNQLSELKKIF